MVKVPSKYPVGEEVPKGGSNCGNCNALSEDGKHCERKRWQDWSDTDVIPVASDRYCCLFWAHKGSDK